MSGAEGSAAAAKKQAYFAKLTKFLEGYNKVFIVGVDNVGSNHMQKIRHALRGKAEVLMGKNTMIRKVFRGYIQQNPQLEPIIAQVRGNVGFVFVKDDLSEVKKILLANKVAAPAKAGSIAPCDVVVPAGNTGLEPTMTSFFQALNIQTKIAKGQIEITNNVNLIKEGQKVGTSEAALLQKLDIKPFSYGLSIKTVYDNGTIYDAKVLDLSDEDIVAKFQTGVKNIAALGLQIGYPTVASLPHSIIRGFKNVLAISLATEYTIKQAEEVKKYLENPGAFAAAAPAATSSGAAPAKEEKKEEKVEEEDEDMGFGLFD
jgi:large subunit ribosomal protein LP0